MIKQRNKIIFKESKLKKSYLYKILGINRENKISKLVKIQEKKSNIFRM